MRCGTDGDIIDADGKRLSGLLWFDCAARVAAVRCVVRSVEKERIEAITPPVRLVEQCTEDES
jgi:hypothetical protein